MSRECCENINEQQTITCHFVFQGEEQFNNAKEYLKNWNARQKRWTQKFIDYFSGK